MPIDIEKQINYWRKGAEENLATAEYLMKGGMGKEALFFAHLAIEKALKALTVKAIKDVPPYTHDLPYLANCTKLNYPENKLAFFDVMKKYSIYGRYPDLDRPQPTKEYIAEMIDKTREAIQWLTSQL